MIALGIIITFIGGLFLLYDLYVFLALGESGDGLFLLISASVTALGVFLWRMGLRREADEIEQGQEAVQNGMTPSQKKGAVIGIIILIIIFATPFVLNFIPDTPVNKEEQVLKYVEDIMKDKEKAVKDTGVNASVSHTKPKILDHSGDVYFVYMEVTSKTAMYGEAGGGLVVVKVEDKNKCSWVTDMATDTDDEHIQKALDVAKQLYGNG